jgi:hypothetical protein
VPSVQDGSRPQSYAYGANTCPLLTLGSVPTNVNDGTTKDRR